ncbi:MAG: hypothetical protein H6705_14695 [Myxococcales bacterium]|nr:hypothetical protein [Myxococcales bacterium]
MHPPRYEFLVIHDEVGLDDAVLEPSDPLVVVKLAGSITGDDLEQERAEGARSSLLI